MDPVRILAWILLASIAAKPVLAVIAVIGRLGFHYATRDTPLDKYQQWVSLTGKVNSINDIGASHVVVSASAMNLGGVHYTKDEWKKIIRREKLSLR